MRQEGVNKDVIVKMLRNLDTDKKGTISQANLKKVFTIMGQNVQDKEFKNYAQGD